MALRDCDYGRWRGLASKDVAEREPDGFAAWLGDPAAAPHGGESLAALIERIGAWLTQSLARESATLAVTHASVVRAAIVNALGAGSSAFARIDVAPLSLARLSGHGGTLESCGARAFGRPVVRAAFVVLVAALLMLGTSPSQAHRISTRSGPPPVGVSIPSLTHGQMAVIRDNLPAIRALASARLGST